MAPIGDGKSRRDNTSKTKNLGGDSSESVTQQIGTRYPAGDAIEDVGTDDFLYFSDTMLINDDSSIEDSFGNQLVDPIEETQLVDLVGETQLVDLEGGTQLVDIAGETQLVDLEGETQLVDLAGETQQVDLAGETQVVDNFPIEFLSDTDASHNHPLKQGSASKGFTSIRAASIRASGLAACARGSNGSLCTSGTDNSTLPGSLFESGQQLQNMNSERNVKWNNLKKSKVGSTAARKLFSEDDDSEWGYSEDDDKGDHIDESPDVHEMPTSENCLAGLSYAVSQEPGELSQACALEVVDKFLDLNAKELEESFCTRVCNVEKSKLASGIKGSLNLAKSNIHKSIDGKRGIYDWDNTCEDDGGGDFFRKKKNLFFNKGCIEPRKAKRLDTGNIYPVGNNGNKKEQYMKNKLGGTVCSDSRLMLLKLRAREKPLNGEDEVLHNSIVKNLDEQLNRVSGPELAENNMFNDASDIGPDTQVAAEAMENLCFEVKLDDNNKNCVPKKGTLERATRKSCRTVPSEEQAITEPTRTVVTRQRKRETIEPSNKSSSPEQSKKRKKGDRVLGEVEKTKMAKMESASERSAAKSHSTDPSECSVPVAHRTRTCTELNHPAAPTGAVNAGKEINDLINARVLRKKRTPTKTRNVKIITIEQLKKFGLAALDRSNRTSVSASSALNTDAVANEHGKRPQQEALAVGHEDTKSNGGAEVSPSDKHGASTSACRTPVTCVTPVNKASPICMGDEYHKQSCRTSLSKLCLIKEINSLASTSRGIYGRTKELRKRKDITQIKVLFSQHLDDDVVKHQKKILSRLGGAVALCMSEATHFVANEFVRTRNMLEAIAVGKPVVTHLWLESCGQANCLIDEKNYILRDAKKEKEFSFSLPVSLNRACQHPLLQGQKVYITPNTKPGKDILTNLVKAVDGLPIERLGRSIWKDEKPPDDLLILSCEEDYDDCIPFLEKGGAIYSSELLLNGIVKQKLEHERHRLFTDYVKRTRSTIWMKKKNQYLPVTKCK